MAKISANGATKVAEVRATNPRTNSETVYVFCSDGRVLSRMAGSIGTGYTVMQRLGKCRNKAGYQAIEAREHLVRLARRHGLEVR